MPSSASQTSGSNGRYSHDSIPSFTDIPWQADATGDLASWQNHALEEMSHPADESTWVTPEQIGIKPLYSPADLSAGPPGNGPGYLRLFAGPTPACM